jgi:type 1 glutamine amidotransferase
MEKVSKEVSTQFQALKPEARMDALDVLAALQNPQICAVLISESKSENVEYRKAIVRTLSKWNQAVAVDALVDIAKGDADRSVKILATRGALTLLEKPGIVTAEKKATALSSLASSAEREEEKQLIEAALKGGSPQKQEDASPKKNRKKASAEKSVSIEPAIPQASQIRVLLLTGANNHNWQETTESLKKVLAKNPKFAVTVTETPWDMTPDSLASCDVVFFNWNTFGKDKREWSQPMKDAFIPWVKKGGGVFIFHAGGSIFYNWPEFMSLIGGTWEKGTYHPKQQEYTVRIENADHPITKGMKDFVTFDEPWQKLSNRNPDRKMLASTTIPKEKTEKSGGGTGEPEVMAMTTELEKGRCFNLVLGHNGKSIENEGCTALILRGTEWAGTGNVKE